MPNYAVVAANGDIINRIILDAPDTTWQPDDGQSLVPETNTSLEIGGTYIGGVYTAPVLPDAPLIDIGPRLVPKRWIIDRLHEAGKLEAALAVLGAQDAYTQQRWASRDAIYFNDPTLLAALGAIGADASAIMAE